MKKGLFVVAGMLFCFLSSAQRNNLYYYWPINSATQKIDFAETVYVVNTDANTLLKNADVYLKNHFKTERDTITIDSLANQITCSCAYATTVPQLNERGKGYVSFTLTLTTYKNAYRYSLTNLEHHALSSDDVAGGPFERDKSISGYLFPKKYWDEFKATSFYTIQTTLEGLKETMVKQTPKT